MKIIMRLLDGSDNGIVAWRAAKWLRDQPDTQKDAILVYGDTPSTEIVMYVRRNKASITVYEQPPK